MKECCLSSVTCVMAALVVEIFGSEQNDYQLSFFTLIEK